MTKLNKGLLTALAAVGLVCALSPATAYAGHSALAGQWHLDEGATGASDHVSSTPDSSGHGLDASVRFTSSVPGRFANAFGFGASSLVQVADTPELEPAAVTVLAWVRLGGDVPDVGRNIAAKGADTVCGAASYALYTGHVAAPGLHFYVTTSAGTTFSPNGGVALWNGEWHMVAGTYDGATVRLYIDGQQVGLGTPAAGELDYARAIRSFNVGQYPGAAHCGSFQTHFPGEIDETRVYRRALTGTEIGRLAAAPGPDPPALVDDSPPGPGPGPAPAPKPGPPPPEAPPEASPPVPASATFTPSLRSLRPFQPLRLDASASVVPGSAVTEFEWDVTGDGRTDASCGPETPVLQTSLVRAGATTVTLRVSDTAGQTTSAAHTVDVASGDVRFGDGAAGRRPPAGGALARRIRTYQRALLRAPGAASCQPSPGNAPAVDVTALGGPPPGCVVQAQVFSSLLAAVGCLHETSLEDLPSNERKRVSFLLGRLLGLSADQSPLLSQALGLPRRSNRGAAAAPVGRDRLALQELVGDLGIADRVYVSSGPVRINGLDYTPARGAVVAIVAPGLLSKKRPYVISSNATISAPTDAVGRIPLRTGEVVLPVDTDRERIASFDLANLVSFIPSTRLQGKASVELRRRASDLTTQIRLPPVFSKAGGGEVTAAVTLRATNADGMRLQGFEVRNIGAEIAGIGVFVHFLRFDARPRQLLQGRATVGLGPAGEIEGGIAVSGNHVDHLDLQYNFGPPGIHIAPGVFLTFVRGGFDDSLQRTAIFGGVGLAAGGGTGGGCAPIGVNGDFDFRLRPAPITFSAGGEGALMCIPLTHSRFTLAQDGYANFTSGIDYPLGPLRLTANISATYFDGHFTAEGRATGCLGDYGCIGGNALISDRGLAFCASIGPVRAGAGLNWPRVPHLAAVIANVRLMGPWSCDVGPWRTVRPRVAAAQAEPATIEIPGGQRAAVLAVVGADGPPGIALRDPSGARTEIPADGPLRSPRVIGFHSAPERTTFVILTRPRGGRWTVEPLDGARIAELRQAAALPKLSIRARVRRARGSGYVLRYRFASRTGQVVRLVEQAPGGTRELRAVRRSGTLRFTPSDARGSRRAILAVVEQDGKPRDRVSIARFRAGPPAIGRARRIRLRRSGKGVVISWRRAPGAQAHLVGVELSDGRELHLRPRRRSTRVKVAGVARGTRITVRIVGARAGDARRGRPVTTRLRLTR